MDQLYIRLPSNSSHDYYPDNTTSSFTTKLPDELNLIGRWEVGLKEIQYPISWYNIEESIGNFTINTRNIGNIENEHKTIYNMQLPAGYYSSLTKLAEKITEKCTWNLPQQLRRYLVMTFDVITGKFTTRLMFGAEITFHKELAKMMGMKRRIQISHMSRGICDIHRGIYSLYVYCDICKENIIGDSKVPLLQIIPIKGEHGDYICERYNFPTYIPLQRNNISDIKINIMDDTGRHIPFRASKLMVTLSSRKKGLHLQQ